MTDDVPEESELYFNLATFSIGADGTRQISGVVELNMVQHKSILDKLNRFDRIELREMYRTTVKNYYNLNTLNNFYQQLFRGRRENRQIDARKAAFEYVSCLLNWLNSFRIFVEHELTRYSRLYGKNSEQHERFKKATNIEFDSNMAYRIMYKLRNYATHCGLPMGSVTLGNTPNITSDTISFTLNRDTLLEEFKEWGAIVKKDLHQMPDQFEIFPLVAACMKSIHSLMKTVIAIDFEAAKCIAQELDAELHSLDSTSSANALVRYEKFGSGKVNISPKLFSIETIHQVMRASTADEIISESIDEGQLSDQFSTPPLRAETLILQRRGVDILTMWIQESGDSPSFYRHLESIVQQDEGDARRVLVGTVFVAGTLLNIATMASGMSQQEILGSLSELSGPAPQTHRQPETPRC